MEIYDGASVNSRKKNSAVFGKTLEKINLIFFSGVFGKTLEKINLNFFSAILVKKTVEKINLNFFFLLFTLAPS